MQFQLFFSYILTMTLKARSGEEKKTHIPFSVIDISETKNLHLVSEICKNLADT